MIQHYKEQAHNHPRLAAAAHAGLEKLEDYSGRILKVPAYTLAMGMSQKNHFQVSI